MNKYEKPTLVQVDFEAVDVIAISFPDLLTVWGQNIEDKNHSSIDFYS